MFTPLAVKTPKDLISHLHRNFRNCFCNYSYLWRIPPREVEEGCQLIPDVGVNYMRESEFSFQKLRGKLLSAIISSSSNNRKPLQAINLFTWNSSMKPDCFYVTLEERSVLARGCLCRNGGSREARPIIIILFF